MSEKVNKQRNKKSRNSNKIFITISVLVVTVIAIILLSHSCSNKSPKHLKGLWDYDGVTMYEFDGKDNGSLVLPTKNHKFIYIINDDNITIDFEDETAKDFTYKYTVSKNTLTLERKEGSENKFYEFTKVEKSK